MHVVSEKEEEESADLATVDLKETCTDDKIQLLVLRTQQLEHIRSCTEIHETRLHMLPQQCLL